MKLSARFVATTLSLAVVLGAGCDSPEVATTPKADAAPAEPLPASLFVQSAPDGATGVVEARQKAKEGDEVVLRGRVGGTESPLVENRAVLTLLDSGVATCDKSPGDACKTPWDACCEPDLPKKTATVQVVNAEGRPVRAGLNGAGGIKPLKELVVVGKVKGPVSEGQMLVEATKIYVVP